MRSISLISVIVAFTHLPASAGPPRPFVMGDFPDQTDAAMDAEGRIHVAYGAEKKQKAYYRMYPPDGVSPTDALDVSGQLEIVVGHERGPKIALGRGGSIYVLWQSMDKVICVRSSKSGNEAKFEPIEVLDREAPIDVPNIGNDDAGNVYAIWVDHRHHTEDPLGAELYMARTDEAGRFGKNLQVSDDRFPVCPCCMPEVQCSGKMIYVLYRSSKNGTKEMILRRADREKLDWTTTVLSKDDWKFEGCPMSGGRLAASERHVVATWMSDGKYYVAASRDRGRTFGSQRAVPSARWLPLPTVKYLFGERGILDIETFKPPTDKAIEINGKVVGIAWRGAEKEQPRMIVQSKMMHR